MKKPLIVASLIIVSALSFKQAAAQPSTFTCTYWSSSSLTCVPVGTPAPTPTPTAPPAPTATPTRTPPPVTTPVPPTPTPCVPMPGPGGIGGCPTPTPGGVPSATPFPTAVPTVGVTTTPTPTPTATVTSPSSTPPPSLAACTLNGTVQFEPSPPGVSRPQPPLSPGYSNALALYRKGATGPRRLLMMESYGYSVLDLSNPSSPSALSYRALMSDGVTLAGDGQSIVYSLSPSDDGQRVAFGLGNQADAWGTVAGPPATGSGEGFKLAASFAPSRAAAAVQHAGARYLAYTFSTTSSAVTDITTLPAAFTKLNVAGESTGWGGGNAPVVTGGFVVFQARGGTIRVYDATFPGPIGSIVAGFPTVSISSADLAGTPTGFTALYDSGTLWVLVEIATGATSPSFQLVAVTKGLFIGLAKSVKPAWRVPTTSTETWALTSNASSLVAHNGSVYALMFARRSVPSVQFKLYSTTTAAWPAVAGAFEVSGAGFALPGQTASFSNGTNAFLYVPTTASAFAFTLRCN